MYELFLIVALLLPIAWYFGYRNGKSIIENKRAEQQVGLSRKYFTGLNYLLNEESDKAIDTFVSMLEVDSETVETHLALGNLFRKRGEVDRAIRIHQNLIARPSLSSYHQKISLMELGYDYMGAGLLERAENIFKELTFSKAHKQASLKQLLLIYQQTKDWKKAISVSEKIQSDFSSKFNHEIAHFYCELAEQKLQVKAHKEAVTFVKKALSIDPNNARATLLSGEIYFSLGRNKQAIRTYKNLIKQDIELLPEALEKILLSFKQLRDQKGLIDFLTFAIAQGAGTSTILLYANELQLTQGDKITAEYLVEVMNDHPSVKGLLKLIDLHLEHASESAQSSLIMLKSVVTKLLENKPIYHCNNCGFDTKTLFWQCPTCRSWGSVKPIQGIEGE